MVSILACHSAVVPPVCTAVPVEDSSSQRGQTGRATYHLVTTETDGALIDGYPLADVRVSKNGYDAEHGGVSGWKLKTPTEVTADAAPDGEQRTAYAVFDATGKVLTSWGIDSTGADARATESIYDTAGPNSADSACGNHPEWPAKRASPGPPARSPDTTRTA
jgi:hypothetical protein